MAATAGSVDVVVVGAGLAGLTAAQALHRGGRSVAVVEARASVGGRIKTLVPEGLGDGAWLDLGATWHWTNQPHVRALAADLGMEVFPQHRDGRAVVEDKVGGVSHDVDLPPPTPAELRFVGGAQGLCHRLATRLPHGSVLLESEVMAVAGHGGGATVTVIRADGVESRLAASYVVVAVPPRLASAGISFTPALPTHLEEVMQATPTWMATAVKCVAVYESAFWREGGRSGLAFSRTGPLVEVHDGCTSKGETAALWGFVSASHAFRDLDVHARTQAVLAQLGRLFGPEAADPVQYFERDWSSDPYTNDEVVWLGDPQPYGHPAFREPLLEGRLLWAGTETAEAGGGHMEGAVWSGRRAAAAILSPTS